MHTGAAERGTEHECSDLMRRPQLAQNIYKQALIHNRKNSH